MSRADVDPPRDEADRESGAGAERADGAVERESAEPTDSEPRRGRIAIALGLFVSVVAALVGTARGLGYARDEGFYFDAARSYEGWFEMLATDRAAALRRPAVDGAFGQLPPLLHTQRLPSGPKAQPFGPPPVSANVATEPSASS
ncbi:MAG TPA: hypothetical protein VL400_06620, partial [Polyangiaceae bacterium]|nr:hypothetical protein [Polyangiaceae bacterium]